jgi:RHS repeat-associated protein
MRLVLLAAFSASLVWANLPAGFEVNQGQADRRVRYLSRAPGRTLYLTSSEAVLADQRGELRLRLLGANRSPAITPLDPLPGKNHYFTGSDPARWRTNVTQYARVKYAQVYPGIDLVFYGDQRRIEYDFVVAPGADPSRIRFRFQGARSLRISESGGVNVELQGGTVYQRAPEVYQEIDGKRRPVAGRHVWKGSRELGFEVGDYDRNRPLVIDPVILWASYLGGSGADTATGVAMDAAGNVYVAGETTSANFPTQRPIQGANAGGGDAFVAKVSPDGRTLLYSTFLGGASRDAANAVAVDSAGNAYVTGFTGSNAFPVVAGGFQTVRRGGWDVFVTKLNPAGNQLVYSTLLTGTANEFGHGIAIDAGGSAYACGITNSTDFPVTPGAYDTSFNGGPTDFFVVKLSPGGNAQVFGTYLGGSATENGQQTRIAVNEAGNAFLGGFTDSTNFPTTPGAVQARHGGMFDGVVARLSPDGARLEYGTFLGGSRNDGVYGMALDAFSNLYLSGSSGSADFPTSPGTPQSFDGFVARLVFGPEDTSALRWVRFFGNEANTIAFGLTVMGPSLLIAGGTRGGPISMRIPGQPAASVEAASPDPVEQAFSPQSKIMRAAVDAKGNPIGPFDLEAQGSEGHVTGGNSGSRGVIGASGSGALPGTQRPGGEADVLLFLEGLFLLGTSSNNNNDPVFDPVATGTGEHFELLTDLNLGGPLRLLFQRFYGSLLGENGVGSSLGFNWMHNFSARVVSTQTTATVVVFPGKIVRFQRGGPNWTLLSVERFDYQLVTTAEGYRFLDPASDLVYSFDTAGALVRIEDRNGNALRVTPGPLGPARVEDGLGRSLTFRYQGLHLVEVADQTGRKVQFQQTGGNLTQVTDPEGKVQRYNYTSTPRPGLLTESILPGGNTPVTTAYDNQGRVVRQTDSRGNSATLEYDRPTAGVTTITDPLANATRHAYADAARSDLTGSTDAAGRTTSYTYDAAHRPTSVTDRRGSRAVLAYDTAGNPTAITDPAGQTTRLTFSVQTQGGFTFHLLTGVALPDGTSFRISHDASGNVTGVTDRAGKTWAYTYDSRGQLLTERNPAGGVVTHTYNQDGTRASTTLPSGETVGYEYDGLKRLSGIRWADGTTRRFAYNARDQLASLTDERGKTTGFAYNDNGQLQRLTDALQQAASLAYDGDERVNALTDRLGKVLRVTYDAVGRRRAVTNASGETVTLTRDAMGRVVSRADAAGTLETLSRDPEGAISEVIDARQNRWSISRDAMGRMIQVTEPTGGVHRVSYDSIGRPTALVNPVNQRTEISWAPIDLPSRIVLPGQITADFTYTDLGQLGRLTDANGSAWTRRYDSQGRLVAKTDPLNRTITYTYDNRGRPGRVTHPEGSFEFSYDAAGNLIRRAYSDGTEHRFTYDDNNRLLSAPGLTLAYDAEGRIINSNGLGIGRDDAGRVSSVTYAPGKTVSYTRNNRGLVTRITDWVGGATELTYDANLRLASIRRPNGVTTELTHDASGRLVRIVDSGGRVTASVALTRDPAGRVTSVERNLPRVADPPTGSQQFAYDAAHQESGLAAYDGLGRPTSIAGAAYTWDAASRLTALRSASGVQNFSYDAFGMLLAGRHNYVWNYALGLPSIAVFRRVNADLRYFVHLPDGALLYAIDAASNERRFYHFDDTGNTVFLTGDDGAVTDSYGLTPYGEVVSRSGSTDNPFVFQGRYGILHLEGTDLYYIRARFYDSTAARFLTRDPLTPVDPRSANPYPFVWNNPLLYIDPTGLSTLHRCLSPEEGTRPGPVCSGGGPGNFAAGDPIPGRDDYGLLGGANSSGTPFRYLDALPPGDRVPVDFPVSNATAWVQGPQSPQQFSRGNPAVFGDITGLCSFPAISWALAEHGIKPTPEQQRAYDEWWCTFIGEPPPSVTDPQPPNYGDTSKLWSWALGQCGIGPTAAQQKELEDWWRDWVDQSMARQGKRP